MIRPMTENTANQKSNDAIKRKRILNTRNRIGPNHSRGTLICPTKVIIKPKDATKRRSIGKGTLSNYAQS